MKIPDRPSKHFSSTWFLWGVAVAMAIYVLFRLFLFGLA
jgi:hypothetical protein